MNTYTIIRIVVTIISFVVCAYALSGIDFSKLIRKGHESKAMMLYILLSMGLGYLVAQFILSLSSTYIG
ncbi:DUF1146 domain-containing protein [Erysipelothrix larvae]|uniref:DUF1146 domain-containing protein n=1 Tax=Erysipelothrix larvae TaxID=1514105 RepID=UPI00098EE397|nr:DUF1146 domain-containing protein [Erysipelothrix larvae]